MEKNKFLIAYATMSGSTQEIAEFMSQEIKNMGFAVDIGRCREVSDITEYDAVILGAPIYMFHLHKNAVQFLKRHQKQLVNLPIAVFAGGPYGPNVENDTVEVRKNLNAELEKITWLHPCSVLLVGGRFDPTRLRFPYNLLPALKANPASDARNWEEISTWAKSLPGLFATKMTNQR